MDQERQNGGFASGFFVGALVGAAAAMLLAPQAGTETRELLKGKAREAGDLVNERTGDLRGKVSEKVTTIAGDLQASAGDLYSKGRKLVDDARSNIDAAVDEGKNAADGTRSELERNI